MKLKWNGHACFTLTLDDGMTIVTDPFDPTVGYPCPKDWADVVTVSHAHHDHNDASALTGPKRVIDSAGEYAIGGARIRAIESFHDDCGGEKRGRNLIFSFEAGGVRVVHLGDLGHMPTPEQRAFIAGATVMLIPIGGFYTIDTAQALQIIRDARPATAISMHFKTPAIQFPIEDEARFAGATSAIYAKMPEIEVQNLPKTLILPWKIEQAE